MTDDVVPVENSLLFVQQLHRYGVACECHLFESGRAPHAILIEMLTNEGIGTMFTR